MKCLLKFSMCYPRDVIHTYVNIRNSFDIFRFTNNFLAREIFIALCSNFEMGDPTNEKVLSILSNIQQTSNGNDTTIDKKSEVKLSSQKKTLLKPKDDILRGKPKSGKFWKSSREKFSSINKTKGLKQDFQKKTALRIELQHTKDLSRQIQEEMKQKELDRKERRRENIKRTEENRRKAEVVQVITNTTKLKRMRKKQLRFIQKRDTNKAIEANK